MKILVVKFMSLGDVVMASVGFQMIRAAFPDAKISLLTLDTTVPIVQSSTYIDEFIIEPAEIFWQKRNLLKILNTILKLRDKKYDLVVSFHAGKGPNFLIGLLRAKIKILPGKRVLKNILGNDSKSFAPGINHYVVAYPEIAREAISAVKGKSFNTDIVPLPRIDFSENDLNRVDSLLKEHNIMDRRLIALFPGGGFNPGNRVAIKRYPKIGEVIKLISGKIDNGIIVILGALSDMDVALEIKNKNESYTFIDLVGKTSVKTFAGIIKKAAMVITTDSSALHIAQACRVPTVAIFGPTNPNEFVDPRSDVNIIAPRKGKPLYTGKYFGDESEAIKIFDELCPECVAEQILNKWREVNESIVV